MKRIQLVLGFLLALLPVNTYAQSGTYDSNALQTDVIQLIVPQMLSGYDALKIQNVLTGYEEKVLTVVTDITTARVAITYVPKNIEPEDIMQIIFQAGYNSSYKDNEGQVFEMKDSPHIKIRYQK